MGHTVITEALSNVSNSISGSCLCYIVFIWSGTFCFQNTANSFNLTFPSHWLARHFLNYLCILLPKLIYLTHLISSFSVSSSLKRKSAFLEVISIFLMSLDHIWFRNFMIPFTPSVLILPIPITSYDDSLPKQIRLGVKAPLDTDSKSSSHLK